MYVYVFTGNVKRVMEREVTPIFNPNAIYRLRVTLTKHIAVLQYCRMMDLTLTETCGPVVYLSGSLPPINFHQIMCVIVNEDVLFKWA